MSETFILRRIVRDMTKINIGLLTKGPFFLSDFK